MTEQFEKQLEQQRNDFDSKLATQLAETEKKIEESRKLPPAPPPQPAPQPTNIKPKPQKKQKTPEEKKQMKQ